MGDGAGSRHGGRRRAGLVRRPRPPAAAEQRHDGREDQHRDQVPPSCASSAPRVAWAHSRTEARAGGVRSRPSLAAPAATARREDRAVAGDVPGAGDDPVVPAPLRRGEAPRVALVDASTAGTRSCAQHATARVPQPELDHGAAAGERRVGEREVDARARARARRRAARARTRGGAPSPPAGRVDERLEADVGRRRSRTSSAGPSRRRRRD